MLFSEPKIPQLDIARARIGKRERFSALQRAENSSIGDAGSGRYWHYMFQCSSASRKFLNKSSSQSIGAPLAQFQCSSASRKFLNRQIPRNGRHAIPFQCSSASRKFLNRRSRYENGAATCVSVLFSEPKIPQCEQRIVKSRHICEFQCSSASRKFLNGIRRYVSGGRSVFQCSSASRKFLNDAPPTARGCSTSVSVLFSEPKIPQSKSDRL